jgi:drug/metabolite transporter (DMT)-like permease
MSFDRSQRLALPLLIIGAMLVSASGIYAKLSEVGPTTTGFYRMFLSLPVYAVVLLIQDQQWLGPSKSIAPGISKRAWGALWLSGFFLALDLIAWHWAMHYISAAIATLLACTAPVWVALMGFLFMHERFSIRFLLGLAVAMAGVALLVLGGSQVLHIADGIGVVCALLAALCYSFYIYGVKIARETLRVSQLMFWNAVIASAVLLPVAICTEGKLMPGSLAGWATVLGLAITSQAIGQGLIGWSLAHLSASFSSLTLLLTPVGTAFLGRIILGETLTALQIGGGTAVLIGIALAKPRNRPVSVTETQKATDAAKSPKGVAA